MQWWVCLIIAAGVIFLISVLLLIWIMISCNEVVILNKKAVRNFSLVNSKVKEIIKSTEEISEFLSKKELKRKKSFEKIKKQTAEVKDLDGIYAKVEGLFEFLANYQKFMRKIEKEEVVNKSRKLKTLNNSLQELCKDLSDLCFKFNNLAEEYNKKITTFPVSAMAMRFKFEQIKTFELKEEEK